jgi:beta-glucosidase
MHAHVAARFGDRVAAITTHNEPWVVAVLGHEHGVFAPGIRQRRTAMQVAHHLLLSHGLALQALRADGCRSRLGIVLNLSPIGGHRQPRGPAAARLEDGRSVRWYMDPLFRARYPEDVWQHLGEDVPRGAGRRSWRPSRRRWTSSASTTTHAVWSAPAAPGVPRPAASR